MNMMQIFKVGDEIKGYCNGYFGRDDYDDKICILVGPKFAVFQCEDGTVSCLNSYGVGYLQDLKKDSQPWFTDVSQQ